MASAKSEHTKHQIFQGDIFSGVITHLIDEELLFYIVKTESTVVLADLQEFISRNEPSKMFWYPAINEKFLINLDGEYFRSKRVSLTETNKQDTEFMQAFLIDTGETFLIPTNGQNTMDDFSMIPEEFLDVPPLAKKCKWSESTMDDAAKLEFLKKNLLRNIMTFEASKVKGETIFAKIYPYEQQSNDVAQNFEEKLKIDDNKNKSVDISFTADEVTTSADVQGYSTKEDAKLCKLYDSKTGGCFKGSSCKLKHLPLSNNNYEAKDIVFTADEVKELYDEPLATSDALVAVQGYSTKEDAQHCKFYDPKTGGCFKGSLCKLKHLPLSTDNYECRDREEVFVHKKDFSEILPQEHYDIKITFIMTPKKFLFRFNDPDYHTKLEDIQAKVNDPREVRHYTKITFIPEIDQLYLVKIDDEFKRAKVIDVIDDAYIIWCLDEGCLKSASMNTLYDWNLRLNDFKFLTDEMEISNIIPIRDNDMKAKSRLLDFQKSGYLKALTYQTIPTLTCRLFDKDSNDIGEILIKEGYASKNALELCTDFNSNEILPI